jgi:hypothetical protein
MAKVVVVVVGVVVSMMLRTTSGSKVQGFRQALQHKVILAPLTRGGNLPFRRLCVEEGAEMTVSEMAYARVLTKGRAGKEKALLKKAENEKGGDFRFGVQIATNAIAEGLGAARIAQDAGADWIDLNCGCPIWVSKKPLYNFSSCPSLIVHFRCCRKSLIVALVRRSCVSPPSWLG